MSADGEDATVATAAESAAPSTPKRPDLGAEKAPPKEEEEEEPTDGLFPFTTSREEYFDQRTWWMVDLSLATAGGDAALDTLPNQGATPLVKRCMRNYAWDELHARRVLASYRQFLLLKIDQKDWRATKLSPCPHVELMWKEHICDMANYYQDCLLLCQGNMVHYNPDEGEDAAAQAKRAQKTRTSLQRKFGTLYDSDLWNMGLSKEATKNVLKSAKGKGSSSMSMRAPSTMRAGARSGTSGSSNSKPSKTL
uniref:Uncharacterized protein n=1 Tax=Entomoneis paludosa TaxID=265537 RepID=A0A7S2YJ45_9STRA|mmetsp:Transcript_34701/g.72207  ORF Transcript_34701/g.72207 Transcript_34701/m.72207 type:complete len:252 (+) Transcript_34701:182-937(+)